MRVRILAGIILALSLAPTVAREVAAAGPKLGMLQFRPEHNLEVPGCLQAGNCQLRFEANEGIDTWLAQIEQRSGRCSLRRT